MAPAPGPRAPARACARSAARWPAAPGRPWWPRARWCGPPAWRSWSPPAWPAARRCRTANVGKRNHLPSLVEQVQRRRDRAAESGRGIGASEMPQLPRDHGGDALADLGRHVGAGQHEAVVVGVRVDEARRRDAARQVDFHLAAAASRDRRCARCGRRGCRCRPGSGARRVPSTMLALRIRMSKFSCMALWFDSGGWARACATAARRARRSARAASTRSPRTQTSSS